MWKCLTLALAASIPILPLACSSTDKTNANTGGSGGATIAGSAGEAGAGTGSVSGGDSGADNGGESGNESLGAGGDSGSAAEQGGNPGLSGAGGNGGSTVVAGGAGKGGTAGGAGAGGGNACGTLGQACCGTSPGTCGTNLACLSGSSCSCVKAVGGDYIVRTDGAVLLELPGSETQTPVLYASTAEPLLDATAVVNGPEHGCAVRSDGTVWCWRANDTGNADGELGNGTLDTSAGNAIYRATQALTAANTPLTNVKAFASSWGSATCAVTNDAQLYCWGVLNWVVNNGASLASPYAQVVTTDGATPLTGVVQASLGDVVSCAIIKGTSDNEVWCWGYNATYSLGLSDTMNRRYPTKVPGLTNPTQVAVSNDNYLNHGDVTCVVDDPNVRCWGSNIDGGVGIGSANLGYIMSPMVAKLQDGTTPFGGVVDLVPSLYGGFCALRTGASVWCWGASYPSYPSNYGVTNIVLVAGSNDAASLSPRFITSDGVYHMGTKPRMPNCGALQ